MHPLPVSVLPSHAQNHSHASVLWSLVDMERMCGLFLQMLFWLLLFLLSLSPLCPSYTRVSLFEVVPRFSDAQLIFINPSFSLLLFR